MVYNLPDVTIQHIDILLFKQINTGLANPVLDWIMLAASALGTGAAQVALCLVLALFGWVLDRASLRKAGYAGLIACALGSIAAQVAKGVFDRPRPLAVLFDARAVGHPLFWGSFPSGHALTVFAVAAAASGFV
ncbi:MAG: phosphatase PAP2 family protein, partial [Armatimonadota bacterium]